MAFLKEGLAKRRFGKKKPKEKTQKSATVWYCLLTTRL